MMFNKMQLARIWNVNSINSGKLEESSRIEPIVIPHLEEIAALAIDKIEASGFSVRRVSPRRANCVIRVFRHEGLNHDGNTYWMWGIDIFLKQREGMLSSYGSLINFSEYELSYWYQNGEHTDMSPHFVDYFVKLN